MCSSRCLYLIYLVGSTKRRGEGDASCLKIFASLIFQLAAR